VRRTEKRFWTGTGTDETEKEDDGDKDGTDKEEKNVAPGLRGPVGKSKRRRPAIDVAIKKDAGPRTCPAPNGGWDSPWPCGRARHRYCKLSGRPPRWTGAHVGASRLCRQGSSSKVTNRRENNNVTADKLGTTLMTSRSCILSTSSRLRIQREHTRRLLLLYNMYTHIDV